jgi:hypothetical protein
VQTSVLDLDLQSIAERSVVMTFGFIFKMLRDRLCEQLEAIGRRYSLLGSNTVSTDPVRISISIKS